MKDDRRKEIIEIGRKRPNPNLPQDLYVAIDTFMQQTIIVGQNELEYMPPEYMENLVRVVAKYPEYSSFLEELLAILLGHELIPPIEVKINEKK
jgi:hypothetical protein